MLGLSDAQLQAVMVAAADLEQEKRALFLERLAARLQLHGTRFTGADLDKAMKLALTGLIHSAA
jgi:hypothetical protein